MKVKDIKDELFQDYKLAAMFIATCYCDWKCCIDGGFDISVCQNSPLAQNKIIDIDDKKIVQRYLKNYITSAIIFGGLEPMLQFDEVYNLIKEFRQETKDDIVIYTGYYPNEIQDKLERLKEFDNIIVKFGRFQMNSSHRYDEVLGITLSSDNQFAIKIN